ncbi:LexA repressor [uncultured Clostridium sp.]|nr:LexA repressor [uncultured Clostridium sp.]
MDKFGKTLKKLREDRNISAIKFSEDLSIHRGTLSNWETGKRTPDSQTLLKIADYFNVTVDYLLGNTDRKTDDTKIYNLQKVNTNEMVKIPVIGVIKAGIPMLAEENIIDYEYVHQEELMQGENYFYLQIKGDSMINARIFEGDRVLVKKQNFIENDGDIMAVRVNGDEATLKRVYKQKDGLVLQSENPNYAPMFYPASDIDTGYVGIIGKAIEVKIKL